MKEGRPASRDGEARHELGFTVPPDFGTARWIISWPEAAVLDPSRTSMS
ncbi:MAG: hypothetical protein OXO56_06595 [Gammaproteobacteria bacterium]|nr:hypothetical protein [Gammaproteobacteria bacterium]